MNAGYFGIGVDHIKTGLNLGTLWRTDSRESLNVAVAGSIVLYDRRMKRRNT